MPLSNCNFKGGLLRKSWVKQDVGEVFVITFNIALGSWLDQHNACISAPICGTALVLKHNGDVYSCDHFVGLEYRLTRTKTKQKNKSWANCNISCLHHGEQATARTIMRQTTIYHCPQDDLTNNSFILPVHTCTNPWPFHF